MCAYLNLYNMHTFCSLFTHSLTHCSLFSLMAGQVVIAGIPRRGTPGPHPNREGYNRVNVTSGSRFVISPGYYASSLSPLYLGPVVVDDGVGFVTHERFENYWQSGKVYPQLGHTDADGNPNEKWHRWRKELASRLRPTKDGRGKGIRTPREVANLKRAHKQKRIPCWKPAYSYHNGKKLDYVDSRKQIYVPTYLSLIRATTELRLLKERVQDGENIMILDFDGPDPAQYPNGLPVTVDTLRERLHDEERPFGHGYVVAAELAGVDITAVCA